MSNANNSNSRRARRPQQQREITASPSVLIEDEQPHKFYADLVMLNNRTQRTNQIMSSSPPLLSNSGEANSNANVIQEDEQEKDQNSDGSTPKSSSSPTQSEFAKVFQRALTNPPQFSKLALDRTNRGYQMLQNMGWKEKDGGLGRHRQGTLVPFPRTKLKNNQTGLGRKRKRMPRKNWQERNNETITQTIDSRKSSSTKTKAKKKLHPQHQEAQQMKRIRMLLRTDVTDQYEDLYLKLT